MINQDIKIEQKVATVATSISMKDFLESVAPQTEALLFPDLFVYSHTVGGEEFWKIIFSDIALHCTNVMCGEGNRFFTTNNRNTTLTRNKSNLEFITYTCRNCGVTQKTYALSIHPKRKTAYKLGEYPTFGSPIPAKLIRLLQDQKDNLLKGRRCENQGLGVAAFAYYRRIIEAQRDSIFDAIIKVAKTLGAAANMITDLEAAKKETQFSKGVDKIRHGIPEALLINGHNPLTLLHSALSQGLHSETDEECLELATSIRLVLTEFVEKVSQALKQDAEVNKAVSNLLKKTAKK